MSSFFLLDHSDGVHEVAPLLSILFNFLRLLVNKLNEHRLVKIHFCLTNVVYSKQAANLLRLMRPPWSLFSGPELTSKNLEI